MYIYTIPIAGASPIGYCCGQVRKVEQAYGDHRDRSRPILPGVRSAPVDHPLFSRPVTYTVDVVGDDPDSQVAHTVGLMRRYAVEDADLPEVRQRAEQITRRATTDEQKIEQVWRWVKGRLTFLHDDKQAGPLGLGSAKTPVIETLIRPRDMLMAGSHGDCDDYAMLCACLLHSLGIKTSYATVAADAQEPRSYSHVYAVAYTRQGDRIPLDASHGPHVGWEAPNRYGKFQEWPLDGSPVLILLALGVVAVCMMRGAN